MTCPNGMSGATKPFSPILRLVSHFIVGRMPSLEVHASPSGLKRGQIMSRCHLMMIVRTILAIANTFSIYSEHPTSRIVIDLTQDDNDTDVEQVKDTFPNMTR